MQRHLPFPRMLLLSLCWGIASAVATAADYVQLVGWADEAVAREKWDAAATYLQEAMRKEPGNANNILLLSNLGMIQFYSGRDSLALHTLTEARAMAPGSVTILRNRARVLNYMGRTADARADYARVIEMDTTQADAYLNHATLSLELGDTAGARPSLEKLEQLRPDNADTWRAVADYHASAGRYARALPYYDRLVKAEPSAEVFIARSIALMELERLQEAAEDIAAGLALEPQNAQLYVCRAMLNRRRFRPDDADMDARHAQELMGGSR